MRWSMKLAVLSMLITLVPIGAGAAEGPPQLTRVIVQLAPGGPAPESVAQDVVGRFGGGVGFVYRHAVLGFSADLPEAGIEALRRNPVVVSVGEDRLVSIAAHDQPSGYDRIEADLAPAPPVSATGCPAGETCTDVDIAILDTGTNAHPDLNVVARTDCSLAGLFFSSCSDGSGLDGHGHGSHVAGTAAAFDNDIGVVGVSPGARIHSVKVLADDGSGYLSGIIAGVDWATARADVIEVANMSLGGYFSEPTFDAAIAGAVDAGIVFAVAAGNDGGDAADFSPANHPDVLAVSAVADADGAAGGMSAFGCRDGETDDTIATFSNHGAVVDIAAPGVCITSTWNDGDYHTISGTSMASPHVAGAAGRYAAVHGRDLNGDGVVDGLDVGLVKAALIGDGIDQSAACGFSGDPDGFPEPLLFVNGPAFGGDGTCQIEPVDTTPPTAPEVTAVAAGYPIDVSWTAAEDPESGILEYRLYRDGALFTTLGHTVTSYRDRDTVPGGSYEYRVEAVNLQLGMATSGLAAVTASADDPTDAGWWGFEEGVGTVAGDSTAWRRDVSLVNGPAWVTREAGGAVALDGSDDRIDLDPAVLDGAGDVTASLWIRTTKTGAQALISGANPGNDNEFLLYLANDTTLRFYVGYSPSAGVEWSMGTIADWQWHHLALVRNQSLNRVTAYRDGVSLGTWGLGVALESLEVDGLVVGQEQDTVGGGYQAAESVAGAVDEVRLFTRVLTASEVADLAQRDSTPPTAPGTLTGQAGTFTVDLDWTAATDPESGIAGYEIWRDDGAGSAKTLRQQVDGTQTTWRDTAVRPETTYRYEVVARNGAELAGPASPEAAVTSGPGDATVRGWWALDDGSGTAAADWSGYARAGSLVGGPAWSSTGVGGSLSFDGADDHVTLDSAVLDGLDDLTVSLRFRTTKTGIQAIVSGANAGNDGEFLIAPVTSTAIRVYTGETWETHHEYAVPSISDGEWHHLAVTRQGSTDSLSLYLDGVSYGTFQHVMNPLEIDVGGLLLGQEQDSVGGGFDPTQAFAGSLDEVRFYDRVLTADEVADRAGLGAPLLDFDPPVAPTGLAAVADSSQIVLDWNDNTEDDLASYTVHRSETTGGGYAPIATGVTVSGYVDSAVLAGVTYFYVVTAVDGSGNESVYSVEVSATVESAPPAAPTGLTATGGVGEAVLDWDDQVSVTFSVYRSETSGGPYSVVVSGLSESSYVDAGVAAGTYFYVVTAVDGSGNESDPSPEVSATVESAPPAAPTGLTATAGVEQVSLDWDDQASVTFTVYRFEVDDWVPIASGLSVSEHLDTGLLGGETYRYVVTAVAAGVESAYSDEASATATAAPESFEVYASSETTLSGSVVSGSFASTHDNDGVAQVLQEEHNGGRPALRVSSLDHRWTFDVGDGTATSLIIDAHRTANADNDDFSFEYSVNGSAFSHAHTVVNGVAGDPVEVALPEGVTGTVTIRVVDTDRTPGNSSLDEVHVDLLALVVTGSTGDPGGEEPPAGVHHAYIESTSFGTVSGSLFDTVASDDVYEAVSEVAWAGGNRTRLGHTWTFDVTPGASLTLFVEAFAAGGEDFTFAYSLDGSAWTTVITVDPSESVRSAPIAASSTGTIHVRVTDTNRDRGDPTISTISVDTLYITSS